jgi:hypothetical protein
MQLDVPTDQLERLRDLRPGIIASSSSSSSSLGDVAIEQPTGGKNMDFIGLILLLWDAEQTLPHLAELAGEIELKVAGCSGKIGPLKTLERALSKTFEKYHGDYRLSSPSPLPSPHTIGF